MSASVSPPGTKRKLVLGFDVGTTFSGISYRLVSQVPLLRWIDADYDGDTGSIVDTGQIPSIYGVTK